MFDPLKINASEFIDQKRQQRDSRSKARSRELAAKTIQVFEILIQYIAQFFQSKDSEPVNPDEAKKLNVYLSLILITTNFNQWPFYQEHLRTMMDQLTNVLLQSITEHNLFLHLHVLLQKGLARHSPTLTKLSLTGIFTLAMRPLLRFDFLEETVLSFASQILSVPGFILHVNSSMNEAYDVIVSERLCSRIITVLYDKKNLFSSLLTSIEGSYLLCLLANLIQLSLLEGEVLVNHCYEFCIVLSRLITHLSKYVGSKKSHSSSWHPVLGWFGQSLDSSLQAAMPRVTKQLHLLWNDRMVHLLFTDLYDQQDLVGGNGKQIGGAGSSNSNADLLPPVKRSRELAARVKRDLSQLIGRLIASSAKVTTGSSSARRRSNVGPADLPHSLKAVCMLYCCTVGSLKEIRNDILAGLSLGDLLPRLWRLLSLCGSTRDWASVVLKASTCNDLLEPSEAHIMLMFCSATSNLLSILDDMELFELGKSFSTTELASMSRFFNQLVYETVATSSTDPNILVAASFPHPGAPSGTATATVANSRPARPANSGAINLHNLFASCLRLLAILYERNYRHTFMPADQWFVSGLKMSNFIADLRKPKATAAFLLKNVPHIVPHKERVQLFRDLVRDDKALLGIQTRTSWLSDDGPVGAVVTINRNRIVEDGYQKLAGLTSSQLRMKIRVQFVNEMGLDEVGIDLDGVFKEFLEETIRRVFDPGLNLFRVTSENRLYPSPTSYLQESHLRLFEFLGKMLAKAVYEGIVVDVPFANFFLTQLLGRERAGCYSFLDELATLDRDLYKSLSYIKHYDGDVSDLEFTYSYSEDCLGQPIVHDLCPGGSCITVTNDLKISYVHRVAQFRMYKQIRAQTASFITGFYSILNPDWLAMFSPPELQALISGDTGGVDISDLKQNTRYSGGFHSNHRVIRWLWDVLRRDFNDAERSLFLKDTGDTIGSVLKGFFGMGSRREETSRLPTASTCFNLLKLPNYSSRSVLRDKLRYAINSNAGFELS